MSNYFDDEEFVKAVTEKGRPKDSAFDTLFDVDWANIFARWADTEQLGNDQQGAAQAMKYYAQGNSLRDLQQLVVDRDAPFAVNWPPHVGLTLDRVRNGSASEKDGKDDIYRAASEFLEPFWARFQQFVYEINGATSAPALQDTSSANIDRAVVDGINQKNLKDLGVGAYLYFWQKDGIVLLGEGHPASYYEWAGGYETGYRGTVQMDKKGGFLDTGKVFVAGAPDEDAFDAAIRRFSKKKVTHGPYSEEDDDDGAAAPQGQAIADPASWLAAQVNQRFGLDVTWSNDNYVTWVAQYGYRAMWDGHWPEMRDARRAQDEGTGEVWDYVAQLAQQQGWVG